jgi:acyl carrier protein
MDDLKRQIKDLMVTELMLPRAPDDIPDDAPIFRPEGLGLDSVDALQLVVALEKRFGLKLQDSEAAKNVLQNVGTIATAVAALRAGV